LDSESDRFALHEKARQIFGAREGDILMEHLPPAGWSHLVSKDDLELNRVVLREEIREVRTELKTEMAELRTELKTEMAELRTELKTEMERSFRNQTWKLLTAIISSNAATLAVMGFMITSVK